MRHWSRRRVKLLRSTRILSHKNWRLLRAMQAGRVIPCSNFFRYLWRRPQLRVDAGFKKQIPLDHEFMKTFLDYEQEFGGANRVLVAVMDKNGNMFNKSFMQTMENVTNEVIALDAVDDGGQEEAQVDNDEAGPGVAHQ